MDGFTISNKSDNTNNILIKWIMCIALYFYKTLYINFIESKNTNKTYNSQL